MSRFCFSTLCYCLKFRLTGTISLCIILNLGRVISFRVELLSNLCMAHSAIIIGGDILLKHEQSTFCSWKVIMKSPLLLSQYIHFWLKTFFCSFLKIWFLSRVTKCNLFFICSGKVTRRMCEEVETDFWTCCLNYWTKKTVFNMFQGTSCINERVHHGGWKHRLGLNPASAYWLCDSRWGI